MNVLVFDTETTGLPDWKLPANHPSQPHIVQIAAMLVDDEGDTKLSMNLIISPNGWEVPDQAAAVHGITTETALTYGISINLAMVLFLDMYQRCDYLVAHNIPFDLMMLKRYAKNQESFIFEDGLTTRFDTMKMMTDVCQLPLTDKQKYAKKYNSNIGDYKQPTLTESYWHLFSEDLAGAHDAMVDVEACKDIFFEMRKNEKEFIKGIVR